MAALFPDKVVLQFSAGGDGGNGGHGGDGGHGARGGDAGNGGQVAIYAADPRLLIMVEVRILFFSSTPSFCLPRFFRETCPSTLSSLAFSF